MPDQPPADSAYIAALWEHPGLCIALFGVQFHTPEGERRYAEAGINEELFPALEAARQEGLLLLNRIMMTDEGPLAQAMVIIHAVPVANPADSR